MAYQKKYYNLDLFVHQNRQEIYSFHPGGAVFLYGDGAVKFEAESMDPVTFANLFTRAGGEVEFRE
jgi:prepilin-type processing-associated H-X9-DG protein